MSKNSIKVIGDEKIKRVINNLPKKTQSRRFWRDTARASSRPLVQMVKTKIPIGDPKEGADQGYLKRSIKYRNYSANVMGGRGGFIKAQLKPTASKFQNPSKMSVIVNNRGGNKPISKEKIIKNPFTEAVQSQGGKALKMMEDKTAKFIQRQIKALVK